MEKPQSLLTWVEHNKATAIGLAIAISFCILFMGCQSKGNSIINPGEKVTLNELNSEVIQVQNEYDAKIAQAELSLKEIKRKDKLKAKAVNVLGSVAQLAIDGTLSPTTGLAAMLTLIGGAGGVGLVVDNRKKNKIIADAKKKTKKT